ncbi:MAG: hypothetical protein RLZZ301_38 [Bacteroidota bacterium]|jgi:hypothetical protein
MKHLLSFLFVCLSTSLFAQKNEAALLKSYSKEEIAQFHQEQSMPLYDYAVDHACYLIDAPQGKDISQFPVLQVKGETISLNFTDHHLKLADATQYFRIEGSNRILVLKSKNILSLEMKNSKR